jgi:hypothetical protein
MIDIQAFAAIPAKTRFMLLTDRQRRAILMISALHVFTLSSQNDNSL